MADNLRLIHGAGDVIAGKTPPESLGVTALGDDTLVVTLETPAPYFPRLLSHPATFPVFSELNARSHNPAEWVSNGPYVLVHWQNGSSLELKRNENYWDNAHVGVSRVIYQFSSDESTQYKQYRAGELDMTDSVPAAVVPELRRAGSKELVIAPFLATAYYGLNLTSKPLGQKVKLRQALSMAIDRHRLVDSLGFGQPPAFGFIPPGTANYEPQSVPWKDLPDDVRIAEAKRLYASAGYSPQFPLHLRVLYNSNAVIKRTAIMIAAMWKETLGVNSSLNEEEYRSFLVTRHNKSEWDVARLAWSADFNDASNFLFTLRSKSVNNDQAYANGEFDALLDQANATSDIKSRRSILESAERMMLSDYPIVPLYYYVSKRLVKPYVSGVDPTPSDRVPSKALAVGNH